MHEHRYYNIYLQQTLLLFLPFLLSFALFFGVPGPVCSGCRDGGNGQLQMQKMLLIIGAKQWPNKISQIISKIMHDHIVLSKIQKEPSPKTSSSIMD